MSDDDLLKRQKDFENLSKIPTIEYKVDSLIVSVKTISDNMVLLNGVKTDVNWLKKFFWSAIAVIGSLFLAVFKLVIK